MVILARLWVQTLGAEQKIEHRAKLRAFGAPKGMPSLKRRTKNEGNDEIELSR